MPITKADRNTIATLLWDHGRGAGTGADVWIEALLNSEGEQANLIASYALGKEVPGFEERLTEMYFEEDPVALRLVRDDVFEVEIPDCGSCAGTGIGQYGDPDTSSCSSCGGKG